MTTANTHGGARANSGRKPNADRTAADEAFSAARARRERANATRAEIALAAEARELIRRDAVQQAAGTALSVLTQTLRSVPDNLERTHALQPEIVEALAVAIDAALSECAAAFRTMAE